MQNVRSNCSFSSPLLRTCRRVKEWENQWWLKGLLFNSPENATKYFLCRAAGRLMPYFVSGCVLKTAAFLFSNASCERILLNVSCNFLVQWEWCRCSSDFHWNISLKAFSFKVIWILINCPHRKVEDLQFRVEEESITKGDLEVKHLRLCKQDI